MRTIRYRESSVHGVAERIRRRSIRRAIAHGALLLVPFTYALVTLLR